MTLYKNATLIPMDGPSFKGDLLIDQSKIKNIGKNLKADSATIFDMQGKWITPGFIDISTCVGIVESGKRVEECNITNISDKVTPQYKMIDGLYIHDEYFQQALVHGVTSLVINSKYESPLGGQSCALKTGGKTFPNRILSNYVDMHGRLGNPAKNNYDSVRHPPLSRMGVIFQIRKALQDASDSNTSTLNRWDKSNCLIPVLKKQVPLKLMANKVQDILKAIEISDEFQIKLILDGGSEVYQVLDEIKSRRIPLIIPSLLVDNSSEELMERVPEIGKILSENNLLFCFSTHHPEVSVDLLLFSVCLHVKHGTPPEEALKAVTINPAKIMNLDSRIGSLTPGKDADFVIFDGDPLLSLSKIERTVINGEIEFQR